jgi:tetratricopeptide (TPR) repeat protein
VNDKPLNLLSRSEKLTKETPVTQQYRQDLEEALKTGETEAIETAQTNLALALFSVNNLETCLELLDQVIASAETRDDLTAKGRALGKKGVVLLESGQLQAARECLDSVLLIAEELDDNILKSDALSNIGLVLNATGDPGKALVQQHEALEFARETEEPHNIMLQLGALGHAYLQIANFVDAGKSYLEALQLARELEDQVSELGFLNNLGIIFINMDQHENAIKALREANHLAVQLGDYAMALNAQKHLSKQLIVMGDLQAVIEETRAAIELIDTQLPSAGERSVFEDMLLLAYMSSNAYPEAKKEILKALAKAKAYGDKYDQLKFTGMLADTHYALDETEQAVNSYQEAIELAVRLQEKPQEAKLLGRLAAVYADQGDLENSNSFANQAIELGKRHKLSHMLGEQYFILALNAKEAEELEQAAEYCKMSITEFQRSSADAQLQQVSELLNELTS